MRVMSQEVRSSRVVGMRQRVAWTGWYYPIERKVTWAEMCKAEPQQMKLLIQGVYNVDLSPSNLEVWGKV